MEIFFGQTTGIQILDTVLISYIFSILDCCPLILQTDIQFTYIIYKLRIDSVKLVYI